MSKWRVFQGFTIVGMVVFFYLVEVVGAEPFQVTVSSGQASIGGAATAVFLVAVVSFLYLLVYFEAKERPDMLRARGWRLVPVLTAVAGTAGFVALFFGMTNGSAIEWMEQWRGWIYMMLVFFIAMLFFFVFSIVARLYPDGKDAANVTLIATNVLMLGALFLV